MSIDHRYLWSTAFVRNVLVNGRLSEAATFKYFLAIMAFDWLQFTLIATTPTPSISPWSTASSWATFTLTLFGLLYLHHKNGGATGKEFLYRYFPLSLTVGWKFVVAFFAFAWFVPVTLAGQSSEVVGWSVTIALALTNLVMFWRIGFHLELLSRSGGA